MPSLPKPLRTKLEATVKLARTTAEAGARAALSALGVAEPEPFGHLTPEQRALRVRLRAHARQLGDALEGKVQNIRRLEHEVAYEHWHRMLFARFLAENGLLVEPSEDAAVSLEELEYYADQAGRSLWEHAGHCAHRMLPAVFRPEDPALALDLPQEHRGKLERLVAELDRDTFLATDSLGWTYQFWQAEQKDVINKSGNKIGADELPAVTQLFTEDYMVDFLLDNTLGAWWAGKVFRSQSFVFSSEAEARQAARIPGADWHYLRFIQASPPNETENFAAPAAGTFDGWPKAARELRVLDPCMGSGHFIVALFERLVALRMAEEGLEEAKAQDAVIRDNLFGLELDPRCTQIAAFNLALAAWRRTGHRPLPVMHLACSGIAPNTTKDDWLALAARLHEDSPLAGARNLLGPSGQPMLFDARLASGMSQLYDLFQKAPELGSLIDPQRALDASADLFQASFSELAVLLDRALQREAASDQYAEMALAARGLAKAAEILGAKFHLVATNVPYLGTKKQDDVLKKYIERMHPTAKTDLATCFVERCLGFCDKGSSTALVTPHNWLFLGNYEALRQRLLTEIQFDDLARLGPRAFDTISGEIVNVALLTLTRRNPLKFHFFMGLDVSYEYDIRAKAKALREVPFIPIQQFIQSNNPNARITLENPSAAALLSVSATDHQGLSTGDNPHFRRSFWEIQKLGALWEAEQSSVENHNFYGGRSGIVMWSTLAKFSEFCRPHRGNEAWGRVGVTIAQMGKLPATVYNGHKFDTNTATLIPKDPSTLTALWTFCSSSEFYNAVRQIDQAIKVTNTSFGKVPFDLAHWQKVAAEKYPNGLPKPHSDDPTQWLFNGHPRGAERPLHVAVARLAGYHWPRQTGSSFPDCPALGPDNLDGAIDDGAGSVQTFTHEDRDSSAGETAEGDAGSLAAARAVCGGDAPAGAGHGSEAEQRDEKALTAWAAATGHLIPADVWDGLERLCASTSEHEVRAAPEPGRVWKRTLPGGFGWMARKEGGTWKLVAGGVREYLERMELQNAVFGDDIRLEGIVVETRPSLVIGQPAGEISLIISQSFRTAADPAHAEPEEAEVRAFMEAAGFHALRDSFHGWHRSADGVTVLDAKPDNFIAGSGGVVPIDLVMIQEAAAPVGGTGLSRSPGQPGLIDEDGIVPLTPLQGEDSAADRLRSLLAAAFGAEWSPDLEASLLAGEGYAGWSLADWLRDRFFEDHCALFHQRPFVWHLWDGHPRGFACLVNYHQLAAPDGAGRRTLEKLTYTYLGDWITRQRAAKAANEPGADDRLVAAEELKKRLEAILAGEPPHDLFIRWKPLSRQPLGWDPDINDGVRLNLRPFLASDLPTGKKGAGILRSRPKVKWDKDRGKEPERDKADYPWFWTWDEKTQDFTGGKDFDGNRWNDLHYTRAAKQEARRKV